MSHVVPKHISSHCGQSELTNVEKLISSSTIYIVIGSYLVNFGDDLSTPFGHISLTNLCHGGKNRRMDEQPQNKMPLTICITFGGKRHNEGVCLEWY